MKKKSPKYYLTFDEYVSANGKYPERLTHPELTDDIKTNIRSFLVEVNLFFAELCIEPICTSGWRPDGVKGQIVFKSQHELGSAVDISDNDGVIKAKILSNPQLLVKYDMWLEHPDFTPNWCHLDKKKRSERLIRVFRPY